MSKLSPKHHYAWDVTLHYPEEGGKVLTPYRYEGSEPPRSPQEYADWRLGQQVAQYKYEDSAPTRIVVRVFNKPVRKDDEPAATAEWP